jgi:predicted RNase H-like nuclease
VEVGVRVGVDAYRNGWVAVLLDQGSFARAHVAAHFKELIGHLGDADVIAVDIPIGTDHTNPRPADVAARKFVGRRRSSVFLTPPRPVLEAPDYSVARQVAREQFGIGVSAQAYSLAPRILEVDEVARLDPRIIEVHPEVSFRAMSGNELQFPKTSWNGLKHREELLAHHGIQLPDNLGEAGVAKPDDVVDAAAAAWTAHRYATGSAGRLPEVVRSAEQDAAIWY